jgi:hypothetical protein
LPALGLFLVSVALLWRSDRRALGMLGLPGLFALLASPLRLYPAFLTILYLSCLAGWSDLFTPPDDGSARLRCQHRASLRPP